jgi:hypothetical protein
VPLGAVLVKVAEVVLHKGEVPDIEPALGRGFTVITFVATAEPQMLVFV